MLLIKTDVPMGYNGQNKMKNKKRIALFIGMLLSVQFLASCGMTRDSYEGFREGWNMTTPEEWHL